MYAIGIKEWFGIYHPVIFFPTVGSGITLGPRQTYFINQMIPLTNTDFTKAKQAFDTLEK
jgi:hypothetical protein